MTDDKLSRRDLFTAGGTAALVAGTTATARAEAPAPVVQAALPEATVRPGARIKVLCLGGFAEADLAAMAAAGPGIELVRVREKDPTKRREEIVRHIADADVCLGAPPGEIAARGRKLKWIQHLAAGVDEVPRETLKHPAVLTNMQRIYAPVIAESALALLLALTRGLVQTYVPAFRERRWGKGPNEAQVPLDDLFGKTMGIVGLGGIGTEVSRRAHAGFEMRILAVDPKPMPCPAHVEALREPAWLPELAAESDVLVSCAPHTRETERIFNEALFRTMKRSAYFINVSRGALVDQDALARALKEGWIRGAGLDVTTPEPLPPSSALWDCPNLVITPHNSGAAPSRERRRVALVVENLRRYTRGLPLLNVVDKARGY